MQEDRHDDARQAAMLQLLAEALRTTMEERRSRSPEVELCVERMESLAAELLVGGAVRGPRLITRDDESVARH